MNQSPPIEKRILGFLRDVLENEQIDLLVCAERKATAIVRALMDEIGAEGLPWNWSRVVSTAVMDQYAWEDFEGHRVLLFDELIHHGNTLRKNEQALRDLASAAPNDVEIVTAGFAVWDKCEYRPHHSYYGAVDAQRYEEIREHIVVMLQYYGSLLLDTEHIELSVRLQCGIREFYDHLARCAKNGNAFSFVSGIGRTNVTIDQPELLDSQALDEVIIEGSTTDGAVRKVRALEKSHEEFSLIPIFYPNTRCVPTSKWAARLPGFLDRKRLACANPTELFYALSLLSSIEVLKSVMAALGDLSRAGKIAVDVPEKNFDHLHAMFPRLNVRGLCDYICAIRDESLDRSPFRSAKAVKADSVSEQDLFRLCGRVLARLVTVTDDNPGVGQSWKQFMRLATAENESIGLSNQAISLVADRLIDNGLVVTGIRDVESSVGEPFRIRTFAPEGEVISSMVRQQLMVRIPECLSAT